MAKLTDKDRKNKKGWDFSALADSDGPGSSHELDSFPIEIEKNKAHKVKKEITSVVDPLAILMDNKTKIEKVNEKKDFVQEKFISTPKEENKIILDKSVSVKNKVESTDEMSISKFLKKEESQGTIKIKEKVILEPEIINDSPREIVFETAKEEISIAQIIKPKPASEQEEIEESVEESIPLNSAEIAKKRLDCDLRRPFSNSDFIPKSTQLMPVIKKESDIKKKELFSPWYLVPSDEKNRTYIFTMFLMIAFMGAGSSFLF